MEPKAVAVYCASSVGFQPAYVRAAESLGKALADAGRPLVYGGGSQGIMGAISGAVLSAGGDVTGIVPHAMVASGGEVDLTAGKRGPTVLLTENGREKIETIVVNSMHERKLEMARRSAGFIGLPGGYGTFEEVLEAICWSQIGIHRKPVIVLNVRGFYNPLRDLIRNGIQEGFIKAVNEHIVQFIDGPSEYELHESFDWGKATLDALDSWTPPEQTHFYDWTARKGQTKGDALDAA
ncbi:hypothetical protein WOLCODRAFT_115423 [Wolfiporia cocos MD-104 SS10]|uniref:Cytokinin riboside 5'-monophosphate phosphoribohydrolase n=1 Tax=Wolfiporia cocos (strain MD-104) TaxID=742152 RepID=A0A2H3JI22_WOLCO|nr:hypothetical protein WOLCODRAFT_115423 [Wolfiporia cocos MD-104 SS10]